MAEEGSVIKLTHGKNWGGSTFQSHTSHSFVSLSLSLLSHTLSLSFSLLQNNICYSYTLSLLINSIELIWTSPFQNSSLSTLVTLSLAQVMSHISLSLTFTCDWIWCATWLGLFFCPFFRLHHERVNVMMRVSDWVRINYWALAAYINSLGDISYSLTLCFIPTHSFFHSHSYSHTLIAFHSI